jgi:hypothetical protein
VRHGSARERINEKFIALQPRYSRGHISVVCCEQFGIVCHFIGKAMFPETEITADNRFLGFNAGDWFMMLGGFTLAGLLVWLV